MSVKGVGVATYKDIAVGYVDGGKTAEMVDMCAKTNEMMQDMLVKECNNGTSHKTTIRTGYGRGAWRKLNYGVPQTKNFRAEVEDTTGMLAIYADVDKEEAALSGDAKAFRMLEAEGTMKGLTIQMQETVIYGNENTEPAAFTGIAPRYNTRNKATAEIAENVIGMGGAGANNTSLWLLTWGNMALHGIYPKGSMAGLQHQDLGEVTLEDANKGKYQGYRDHFIWKMGISLRNWKSCGRLCNIDVAPFMTNFSTDNVNELLKHMIILSERIEKTDGNRVWYCNPTLMSVLRIVILNKISGNLTWETVAGKKVMMWDGIPVRTVEAIVNTEAVVV